MRVLEDRTVRTRKEHQCVGCDEIIPAGSVAEMQKNVCDGYLGTVYICKACSDWMDAHDPEEYLEAFGDYSFAGNIGALRREDEK